MSRAEKGVGLGLESLEARRCLTAVVTVVDGDLLVEGDADATVSIVANADGTYTVTDDGVDIGGGPLAGVDDDIRIELEDDGNTVVVDLSNQSAEVDLVYADLGDGDNDFTILGGEVERIVYRGGDGSDNVVLDGTAVDGAMIALLGDGENSVDILGEVGVLIVRGGDDADVVEIGETATVESAAKLSLGDGENTVEVAGTVGNFLSVRGGDATDNVTVSESATVDGSLKANLGDGDNSLTVDGNVTDSVYYNGQDGNDTVAVSAEATVGDDVVAKLGDGENTVTQEGIVGDELVLLSKNETDNDRLTITEANVANVDNRLGEQEDREFGRFRRGGRVF